MKRRRFVYMGAAGAAALLASARFGPALWSREARADLSPNDELRSDPAGILDLPEGFRYRVLQRSGEIMDDGHRAPGRPDGMACFLLPDGRWALMMNHELSPAMARSGPWRPGQAPAAESYDPRANGCVTRICMEAGTGLVSRSNLVLAGSDFNCAGGPSPWGWLSCEESPLQGHGYVFLCDPMAEVVQPAKRIDGYGRFVHEAVAIDPTTHAAFLTEDRPDGCLYRFLPTRPERPFAGKLQAMGVKGRERLDTGRALSPGTQVRVKWIDLPTEAQRGRQELRAVASELGAARVHRGEGAWYDRGRVFFSATTGGSAGHGQVLELDLRKPAKPKLRVVTEAGKDNDMRMPDNLTMAPWGELIVAEDGLGRDHLHRVSLDGKVTPLARNANSLGELTGVCFSPDGSELYVNLQEEGLTLGVRGPWPRASGGPGRNQPG